MVRRGVQWSLDVIGGRVYGGWEGKIGMLAICIK